MKLSMSMLAWYLRNHDLVASINNDSPTMQGIRFITEEQAVPTRDYAFIGSGQYYSDDPYFAEGSIIANGTSYLYSPSASHEPLINSVLEAFDFFARWEKRLFQAAASHASAQQIADIVGEVITNPMLVTVPDGSVIAYTSSESAGLFDPFWDYATVAGELHPAVRNESFFTPTGDVIPYLTATPQMVRNVHGGSEPVLMSYAIHDGETLLGIGIKQVDDALTEMNRQLLPAVLEYFVQAKELAASGAIGRATNAIVADALAGTALHPSAVARFEKARLAPPYRLIAFEHVTRLDEFAKTSVFDAVNELVEGAFTLVHDGTGFALVPADGARELLGELESRGMLETRRAGVSAPLASLEQLRAGRQQALFCLERMHGKAGVAYCEDHAYSYLIDLLRENPLALDFVHPAIGLLARYDEETNSELVKTLRSYVAHGQSLVETAEDLCVHKNTLKYRMGRIREIAHIDTGNPTEMEYLALSLRMRE